MNFLVIVHHGDYDEQHQITKKGRSNILGWVQQLRDLIDGNRALLLSSTAKRASQSAQVIAESLGVPFEEHEILWADYMHSEDTKGLMALIDKRKDEAEIIILVTHLAYVDRFPLRFARDVLAIPVPDAGHAPIPLSGEAVAIDCLKKRFLQLR
ncbi:MAG: Protein containing Phosphoglycerate mutase // Nucleotidyltransferase [Parcubacteria group bacterium GW2011_GWA2_43_9b]|uniref:Phosphoglycerate mutase n=1 Tax=Candidatus Portnoybacteria bacterium RIFCSPLOWO2_02_FULL_39_11 TaxID=1802001 RepID=A0A1G2FSF4_9BACT|nr:MAG: Protein containing Phosphoglycerate mutase // Nucleotidyltransferase [Parcubacteria group bacterium GW2011_GWA2_43_9b]OGZ40471.1 MAG: hypothetical protein A3B04_01535 [Candidatus Portnoybacteria bacterium RIFCSPLOWO2_02_FULL_39_11]